MIRSRTLRQTMFGNLGLFGRLNLSGAVVTAAFAGATLIGATLIGATLSGVCLPAAAQSVSAKVGKPLQAAEAALAKGQFAAATRDVNEAAAVPGKTDYETFVIEELRGAIAAQSGDYPTAIASFTAEINSGRLDAATSLRLVEAVTGFEFQAKDYAAAATWADRYFRQGGTDPKLKEVQVQAHYLNNDFVTAQALQDKLIKAEIKAGQTPPENDFDLLYSCAINQKDNAAIDAALRETVIYYPKPAYWQTLIDNVSNAGTFDMDRLEYDAGVLRIATKSLTDATDYVNLIQVALEAGHSGAAKKLYDQGVASGVLGVGAPADVNRQQRLLVLINKTIADDKAQEATNLALAKTDPNTAVSLGYNLIDLGQSDQGIALLQQGIAQGAKLADLAELHLGEAYLEAANTSAALTAFGNVGGADGTQQLAQLWILHLSQKTPS